MNKEVIKQALAYIEANAETRDEHEIAEGLRQVIAELEKKVCYSGNGTAGRENTTAPTGFFFQMPNKEKQEPVAWGMKGEDGSILDVICPDEHAREEGSYTIPLYTYPKLKDKNT
jgi:hypothetical protein